MKKGYNKKFKNKIVYLVSIIVLIIFLGVGSSYIFIRQKIYVAPRGNNLLNMNKNQVTPQDHEIEEEEKNNDIDDIKEERNRAKEEVKYEKQKGITNILLIGTDSRSVNEQSRSDSIIIATIDAINKNIKLTSIMRDSYVNIKGYKSQKINASYAIGGPELLMDTIERNFNIKLDKYIIVNFWGFQDIVNAIGGIDINIKDYEIAEMNKFIGEVDKQKSPKIQKAGVQHLDGQQALAYTRIRHVGNGSYERNLRQREVLSVIVSKLKDTSVFQYPSLLSNILPHIKTNIEPTSIMNYVYTVYKFKPLEVKQLQIPLDELSEGRIYKGTWVFLLDKEQNGRVINDFIFKNTITKKEDLNLPGFKKKLNEYLRSERKANPTIKYENKDENIEPYESDHGGSL